MNTTPAIKVQGLHRAAVYSALYPALVETARAHGYALAIHGSVVRDFDLIAVPWIAEAADPLTLIKALKAIVGGCTHHGEVDEYFPRCDPTLRPHGRLSYCIHLTNNGLYGAYIDVAVMPRSSDNLPEPDYSI